MPTFNVRCCCIPEKILGTLYLPEGRYSPEMIVDVDLTPQLTTAQGFSYMQMARDLGKMPVMQLPFEQVRLRKFAEFDVRAGRYVSELAVFSDDKPVEYWRKFPTFKEKIHGEEG